MCNISQYISIYQKPKQTDKNKQTPIILMVKRILIMIEIKKELFKKKTKNPHCIIFFTLLPIDHKRKKSFNNNYFYCILKRIPWNVLSRITKNISDNDTIH